MKQVRFTTVVEQSGKPEVYLLLTDPKKDADFQHALKANRVMTLQRGASGGKTDFGTLGYSPGPRAQVLLFPRALRISEDAHVVGINYELLQEEHEVVKETAKPKAEPKPVPRPEPETKPETAASEAKAKAPSRRGSKGSSEHQPELNLEREAPRPPAKVIPFNEEAEDGEERGDVAKLKSEIRRALKALEAGKQVVAFNILKKILG